MAVGKLRTLVGREVLLHELLCYPGRRVVLCRRASCVAEASCWRGSEVLWLLVGVLLSLLDFGENCIPRMEMRRGV